MRAPFAVEGLRRRRFPSWQEHWEPRRARHPFAKLLLLFLNKMAVATERCCARHLLS